MPDNNDQDAIDAMFNELVADIEPEDDTDKLFRVVSDQIENNMDPMFRQAFRTLVVSMKDVVEADGVEAAALYPVAYTDDVAAQSAFVDSTHDALMLKRLEAIATVLSTINGDHLTVEEVDAWLRVSNDMRMYMTQGVETDEDMAALHESGSPIAMMLYYISVIQHDLLEVLDVLEY